MGIFEMFWNHDKHTLARVMRLCTESDGSRGIWKRIDENRELLECLQKHAPEFLERCPWVDGWLGCQDAFLVSLKRLLNLADIPWQGARFPRPWPGRFDSSRLSEGLVEDSFKKSST